MAKLTSVQQEAISMLEKQIEEIEVSDAYTAFTRYLAIGNRNIHIERCKDNKYYAENWLRNNT